MGTLSPIGGLINVNSNIAATYHNQPTSKPSPKPSNVTTSHTHKLLDNPHRINLTTLNYNLNISDVEYFSIFNSRSNNSKLPFNDKVSQIVAKKNVKEETFANIINSAKTKVKIPSYFIDNYLINLLDDPHHERHSLLTEELKTEIEKLRKKQNDACIVAQRIVPLIYKHDYRLTLSVYLSYVSQFLSKQAKSSTTLSLDNLSLPFSWYDFADLSSLNDDIKLNFFFNWLVHNHQNLPENFTKRIMSIYYDREPTKEFLDDRFKIDRLTNGLELNNFEMFLWEFNRDVNSCFRFKKGVNLKTDLIQIIDDFYSLNFPHGDNEKKEIKNDALQIVRDASIELNNYDSEKVKQILQRKDSGECNDFVNLPEDFNTNSSYNDLVGANGAKSQPGLGYNVRYGITDEQTMKQRIIYGKSYLYNYKGINNENIKPLKLTFLAGDHASDTYEIKINQKPSNVSERLAESGLMDLFIETQLLDSGKYSIQSLLTNKDNIETDFLELYHDLLSNFSMRTLSEPHVFESDEEINEIIDYTLPKDELNLYDDSFVNVDSADVILRMHTRASQVKTEEDSSSTHFWSHWGDKVPMHLQYETKFEKNLDSNDYNSPLQISRNLFKYYKSVKHSNGITDSSKVPKYFYEIKLLPEHEGEPSPDTAHFDWRFFTAKNHPQADAQNVLSHMMQNWLLFTNRYELKTWLAHGTLFSWYFNAQNFPWDFDLDVQMPVKDLNKLCLKFNQSLILENPTNGLGLYFLDCGSSITHRSKENGENNIDARFVDTKTGLYVDITGISFSGSNTPGKYLTGFNWKKGKFFDWKKEANFYTELKKTIKNEGYKKLLAKPKFRNLQANLKLKIVNCRNNHFSETKDLLPLKKTLMEGHVAYVPNNYQQILLDEYKIRWKKPFYESKIFIPKIGSWIHVDNAARMVNMFFENNIKTLNESCPTDQKFTKHDVGNNQSIMKKQVKKINKAGANADYQFDASPDEEVFPYPFDFTEEQALMILNENEEMLSEYLSSQELFHYHIDELKAFRKTHQLDDEERSKVKYSRPDYFLNRRD